MQVRLDRVVTRSGAPPQVRPAKSVKHDERYKRLIKVLQLKLLMRQNRAGECCNSLPNAEQILKNCSWVDKNVLVLTFSWLKWLTIKPKCTNFEIFELKKNTIG